MGKYALLHVAAVSSGEQLKPVARLFRQDTIGCRQAVALSLGRTHARWQNGRVRH
jgi:hypothetical protein